MNEKKKQKCPDCKKTMKKQISSTFYVTSGLAPSAEDRKETEHNKKVKDPERAIKLRKKAFGHEAVGDPKMQSDPRHVVKRGRTLGGQQMEVDKQAFIKAASTDPAMVATAQKALAESRSKKKT